MKQIKELADPFLEYCMYQRRLSENTVTSYRFDMSFFLTYLKRHHPSLAYPDQITKNILSEYLGHMAKIHKAKTVKRKMASLNSFFTYLKYAGIVSNSPFEEFRVNMKEGRRIPRSMTLKDMNTFLQVVYLDPFSKSANILLKTLRNKETDKISVTSGEFFWCRDLAIIELLFATGIRVSELCNLLFSDYEHENRSLRIIGKGNKERTLFIATPEAIAAFDNYILMRSAAGCDISHIFITRHLKPMSSQGVRNIIAKYTRLSGIKKNITPHVFRHTFATLLLESGVDIKYIQDFLGHSSISTTQIYLHTSDEQKKKILAMKHPRGLLNPTQSDSG